MTYQNQIRMIVKLKFLYMSSLTTYSTGLFYFIHLNGYISIWNYKSIMHVLYRYEIMQALFNQNSRIG